VSYRETRRFGTIDLYADKAGNISVVAWGTRCFGTLDEIDGYILEAAYSIIRDSERIAELISHDSQRSWLSRLLNRISKASTNARNMPSVASRQG
jgi:hypothetical protein